MSLLVFYRHRKEFTTEPEHIWSVKEDQYEDNIHTHKTMTITTTDKKITTCQQHCKWKRFKYLERITYVNGSKL